MQNPTPTGTSTLRSPKCAASNDEMRSIAEIGMVTGLDEGTIKSHLFRAARKLRALLEDLR